MQTILEPQRQIILFYLSILPRKRIMSSPIQSGPVTEEELWTLPIKDAIRCCRCHTILDFRSEVTRNIAKHFPYPSVTLRSLQEGVPRLLKQAAAEDQIYCVFCEESL